MSADDACATVLKDRYGCPDGYDLFKPLAPLQPQPGFFRFGRDTIGYGRSACGALPKPFKTCSDDLPDVFSSTVVGNNEVALPFDPVEVIENLRWERYASVAQKGIWWNIIQTPYYAVRPLMPVGFRKYLQRAYINNWRQIAFPDWPVDRTVETLYEQLLAISLRSRKQQEMPFVWFWPAGYSGCVILTHDIESAAGRDFCPRLIDIDQSFGMKSSFQVVPEQSYEVTPLFRERLRTSGCEINLHGLTHDGQLFRERKKFLKQAAEINRYAREYQAAGFRSPVLYRNLEWLGELSISYDMSVPNVAHLDPQRGGCCTVMPYFVGDILELPLTMTQDYALFNILGQHSIDLWKQQIDLVMAKHGLISFNIHPDYIMSEPYSGLYRELLHTLKRVCLEKNLWIALPAEVNQWWRLRQKMQVAVSSGQKAYITGPYHESAALAYAKLDGEKIVYEVRDTRTASVFAA